MRDNYYSSSIIIIVLILGWFNSMTHCRNSFDLSKARILSEYREICSLKISLQSPFNQSRHDCGIRLSPLQNNIYEWHFSFRGPPDSPYESGCYHGRVVLPEDYPRKAPRIAMLSRSGRWVVGHDICLSASNYHQETWNPDWNLRTLVLGLKSHMTTQAREIGSIDESYSKRILFAQQSLNSICPLCGASHHMLMKDVSERYPAESLESPGEISDGDDDNDKNIAEKLNPASINSLNTDSDGVKGGLSPSNSNASIKSMDYDYGYREVKKRRKLPTRLKKMRVRRPKANVNKLDL